MNDYDDTTFARFSRRFARIEELVPQPIPEFARSATNRRMGVSVLRTAAFLGGSAVLLVALAFAVIGSRPSPTVTLAPVVPSPTTAAPTETSVATIPPDSASATTVLDAYLSQIVVGNCDAAAALIYKYATNRPWHGALCGGVTHVTGFRITGDPVPGIVLNEVTIATVLTTTGTKAGLPAGDMTFYFGLQYLQGGPWRVGDWYPGAPLDPSWQPFPTSTGAQQP
jgi:hypothetical protein